MSIYIAQELIKNIDYLYYSNIFIVFLLILFGIQIFYKIFQIKWPELYFTVNDQVSYFISISPIRYLFFRILPPILIASLLSTIILRDYTNQQILYLNVVSLTVHAIFTNGRAIWNLLFNQKAISIYYNKWFQFVIHILTIIMMFSSGFISGYVSNTGILSSIVPTFQGLIDNIWSTLITAVLAIVLYEIYSNRNRTTIDTILHQSYESIDKEIIEHINQYCQKNSASKRLVKSICIAENIQRPKWIRKLEKVKSLIFRSGSYGIMQVQSDKWISDKESVEKAIVEYFKYSNSVYLDYSVVEMFVKKYNPSEQYLDLVYSAFNYLPSEDDEISAG